MGKRWDAQAVHRVHPMPCVRRRMTCILDALRHAPMLLLCHCNYTAMLLCRWEPWEPVSLCTLCPVPNTTCRWELVWELMQSPIRQGPTSTRSG